MNIDSDVDEADVDVHQCGSCGALHVTVEEPVPDACEDCGGSRIVPPGKAVKDIQPRRSRSRVSGWLPGTVLAWVGVLLNLVGAFYLPPRDALAAADGQAVILNADAMARMVPPAFVMVLGLFVLIIGIGLWGERA